VQPGTKAGGCKPPIEVDRLYPYRRGYAARQLLTLLSRGNSTRHFHAIDQYVVERLGLFLSKKHGRSGWRYGGYLLGSSLKNIGLSRLVGSVGRGRIVHAVR